MLNRTVSINHPIPLWRTLLATAVVLFLFAAGLPACAATQSALTISPSSVNFGTVAVGKTASACVVLGVNGTTALHTSLIKITGVQAGQFTSNDQDWYTLNPGRPVTITVTYKPTVAGKAAASFMVTSDDPRGTVGIALTGQTTAAAPNLGVSPASLSFGNVAVGAASAASTVKLSNTGTAALSVSSLTLAGANAGDFLLAATTLPLQIAAGASANVSLTCKPTAAGARSATLAIGSNNPGGTVSVALTGQGTAPNLSVSPASLSFGNIAVGTSSAASTVTLSNTGTAALSVSSLTLAGANIGDFVLSANPLPLQIAAGASASLSLACKPTAAGARSATLAIGSNNPGGTVTVPLTGQGIAPNLTVSPTSVTFGNVTVGATSAVSTVQLGNTGTAALTVTSLCLTGVNVGDFILSPATLPLQIAAGASANVSVLCKPTATGARTATLTVGSNNPAGTVTVPLAGQGTAAAAPKAQLSPASLDFGAVAIGQSASKTFTILSTGTQTLQTSSIQITGAQAAAFTSNDADWYTLAPGVSVSFTVTFTPAAAGAANAQIEVTSNDPAVKTVLPLTGSGSGTAAQPLLQASPTAVAFPSVVVGTKCADAALLLKNAGTATLSVTSLALSGANVADFTLTAPVLPLQIAAGATATVSLACKPTATGTRTGTLTIASNNPSGNVAVALTGTATATGGTTTSHPNDGSVAGTNLSPISDWSPEWAFVDCFKTSRDWISGTTDTFQDSRTIPVDAHNWPTSLQSGQVARSLLFWGQVNTFPSGDYIVLYDGSGTLAYQGSATKVSGTAGRDVVHVDASQGGWHLLITTTTPGNYVRNIRVIMPGGSSAQDPYSWYASAATCPNGDYKSFEQTYQTQFFHPMFLNTIKNYKVLRFMDWMDTNNSEQANWTDRPTPADARWSLKGVPVEIMCSLANTIHADPWFNLPHLATDDYLTQFATVVRDQLAPDLHAYLEYSNEVWNSQFGQAAYAQQQGLALGLDTNAYYAESKFTGLRSVQMFSIFEQVLGGTSRLKRVLATQAAGWYLGEVELTSNNAYQHADVLAIAPYFGTEYGSPANAPTTQNMTVAQLLASINSTELPTVYTWMDANAKLAAKYGLEMVAYEGGQSLMGYFGTENNDTLTALYNATNRDPGMAQVYTNYLNTWKSYGGGMFIHYLNCLNNCKWGYWGTLERLDQAPGTAPKYTALQQYIENNR